jgi:hypothetical protein
LPNRLLAAARAQQRAHHELWNTDLASWQLDVLNLILAGKSCGAPPRKAKDAIDFAWGEERWGFHP